MATCKKQLLLRLEPEVVEMILDRCEHDGVDPAPPAGRVGGPVEWIRRLVHRELGLPAPEDPHEQQSRERRGRPRGR
jgi:hypothetical protein